MKDEQYIEAIKANDHLALRKMYEHFFPKILHLVQHQNGNLEDAQDVLQDALMVIFEKVSGTNFQLTSSFGTYLYSVCRFIWLRKLKKRYRKDVTIDRKEGLIDDNDLGVILIEEEKWRLFQHHFQKLGKECQRVLSLFFAGEKMTKIAEKMNYTKQFAKTKKYLCKQKLVQSIKKDRIYKELL